MALFFDQLGRNIELDDIPKRIISLVPSQTELLYDLGLDEEVIGITKFCIHPDEWFKSKTRIGGTKQLHIQKIKDLQPDLIIANKEENVQDQIEELAMDFPVWISDVNHLNNALEMISSLGKLTGKMKEAGMINDKINDSFARLRTSDFILRTCYLIWRDPFMTVGGDTFINDMLSLAGFQNIFSDKKRYPEISIEELRSAGCRLLLLSSEPFPFKQKHVDELQQLLPDTKILLADGEMFSWYGSRLIKAPAYFQELQNQLLSLMHAGNR
jgi:ABC-type Fe3+-hydroxamate transport system substrate-binding protein